jgi:hypothetical protein
MITKKRIFTLVLSFVAYLVSFTSVSAQDAAPGYVFKQADGRYLMTLTLTRKAIPFYTLNCAKS